MSGAIGEAAETTGRYYLPEGLPGGAEVLEVTARRDQVYRLNWKLDSGKRMGALGLGEAGKLLAASFNTGGAAYGLVLFHREGGGWRGRWITSIDGGAAPGEMMMDGDAMAGRHRFSGRGNAGSFDGTVSIAARGQAFAMNFNSASGVSLYRGIGVIDGDWLAVAWSFGASPTLALYQVGDKALTGGRFRFTRGQNEAVSLPERLTREGADDTIFPPLLPSPSRRFP